MEERRGGGGRASGGGDGGGGAFTSFFKFFLVFDFDLDFGGLSSQHLASAHLRSSKEPQRYQERRFAKNINSFENSISLLNFIIKKNLLFLHRKKKKIKNKKLNYFI